jgi:hypothetical protein
MSKEIDLTKILKTLSSTISRCTIDKTRSESGSFSAREKKNYLP